MEILPWFKEISRSNVAVPWVIVFILINVIAPDNGMDNEGARLATLRAMSEQGSFVINKYEWGDNDWSINEKGEKFANKAPGPMFIGFPVYFILDTAFKNHKEAHIDKAGHNITRLKPVPRTIFSILMQVLPFGLLMLLLARFMVTLEIPLAGIHFTMLALLFGNTSALFMNTYFGHGMSAGFAIVLLHFLYLKNYRMVGLFYGLTLLSEYAAALLFLPLIMAIIMQKERPQKWIKDLVIGGFVPGVFWCWYHIACFGSPFQTAIQHENPIFLEGVDHSGLIFGMFDGPKPDILFELIFGTSRGLLFTQPWILFTLVLIPTIIFTNKGLSAEKKSIAVFSWLGLVLMMLMNSSFIGWHGGMTAGPRYLSIALAPMGLLVGFLWKDLGETTKNILFILLILTLEFRGRVFATTIFAPFDISLWAFQWDIMLENNKHLFLYILWFAIFGITWFKWARKKSETAP